MKLLDKRYKLLYVMAGLFLGSLFLIYLGSQAENSIRRATTSPAPVTGSPATCTEDMECWDCSTMGNLQCGVVTPLKLQKACRLVLKADRQRGRWEVAPVMALAYEAAQENYIVSHGGVELVDALGRMWGPTPDLHAIALKAQGICGDLL